eukprot:Gb_37062 [translate_table: standard]
MAGQMGEQIRMMEKFDGENFHLWKMKDMITTLYLRRKFFHLRMADEELVSSHLNNFKYLLNQLDAVVSPITEEDTVMTLMGSLPLSFESLVVSLAHTLISNSKQ